MLRHLKIKASAEKLLEKLYDKVRAVYTEGLENNKKALPIKKPNFKLN